MRVLAIKDLLAYSLLAMPIAFASLPVYVLAPNFYAESFDISLALLGGLLLFVRIIDGICGPLMGYISDRFAHYRTRLFVGFSLMFVVGFYLLFSPLAAYPVTCFLSGLILCAIAYSFLLINLYALGALWRGEQQAKVTISAFREAMTLTGVLLATIIPTILMSMFSIRASYFIFTCIFVGLLSAAVYWFLRWYRLTFLTEHAFKSNHFDVRAYFRTFTVDQGYFYAIFSFSVLAMSATIVLVNFFVTDYLLLPESYLGGYLFLYFLSAILAIPLWRWLAQRYGMLNTWMIAMVALMVCFAFGLFLKPGDAWGYGLVCVTTGLTLGAELVIPPAILAVLVDNQQQQTLASGYYALNDFITKLALALASALLLGLLQWIGFDPSQADESVSVNALLYLYIVVPCFFKLIAFLILLVWRKRWSQEGLFKG